ncbi:MAG: glycosyltransferase [Cyanothece sp. SIO1E1]|nr:glycosyltransferase [Cyanothece sp. SIO1E1]
MPTISVIVPVYNGEGTIKRTIESVLNQTWKDFELIVINDGSQDSTLEILDRVSDPRLRIFSYPNAGLSASRNRGFAQSSGEFIAFLDADDLWTEDKLEAQLASLLSTPQAAVSYSWTDCIDESDQLLRRGGYITLNGDVYKELLVVNFLANGSNPLIRRKALAEIGEFDETLTAGEDWDMWLRLAADYPFVAVPSPKVLYRQPTNSMSANVLRQEQECLKVIERAFNQAPESLQCLKPYSLANLYKYLTSKALEGFPNRQRALVAARFLWQAVNNDLALLRARVLPKICLKIAVVMLLPSQWAQELFIKFKQPFDTTSMLGYVQINPTQSQS